jgi:hypothetical protein
VIAIANKLLKKGPIFVLSTPRQIQREEEVETLAPFVPTD